MAIMSFSVVDSSALCTSGIFVSSGAFASCTVIS
jgi:hypothetical protein